MCVVGIGSGIGGAQRGGELVGDGGEEQLMGGKKRMANPKKNQGSRCTYDPRGIETSSFSSLSYKQSSQRRSSIETCLGRTIRGKIER